MKSLYCIAFTFLFSLPLHAARLVDNPNWVNTDYEQALKEVRSQKTTGFFIVFEEEDRSPIPWETFAEALKPFVSVVVPVAYAHNGKRLIDEVSFAPLEGKPGIIRFDYKNGKGTFVRAIKESDFSPGGLAFLLGMSTLAQVKAALPEVKNDKLTRLFQETATYWYDEQIMPPGYQDSVGETTGILSVEKATVNNNVFFNQGRVKFPFGDTGGADRCKNCFVANFLSLPVANAAFLPIVYWLTNNLDSPTYHWIFPKGTLIGEVLYEKNPQHEAVVFEIRAKERLIDQWSPDAYRPFLTAHDLNTAIAKVKNEYSSDSGVMKLASFLEDNTTLTKHTMRDDFQNEAFRYVAGADSLPPLKPELVTRLLRETPFVSAEGSLWKSNGKLDCFAPTADLTQQSYHIVPPGYQAGNIPVDSESCNHCHDSAGRKIADFVPSHADDGQVWGSDMTFSLHIFEPKDLAAASTKGGGGPGANALRQEFIDKGMLAKYDPAIHTREYYRVIKGTVEDPDSKYNKKKE